MWAQGSGLFDLDNLKSGEKIILETGKMSRTSAEKNLVTDDLDSMWNSPYKNP